MYGQPVGAAPYAPVARPLKPGPTGPGVAIASALVPVIAIVVYLGLRAVTAEVPSLPSFFHSTGPVIVADLVPVAYLAFAGRGPAGKLLGVGAMMFAMLLDLLFWLVVVVFGLTDSQGVDVFSHVVGFLEAITYVVGWGLARRAGWLWLIGVPIAVVARALMVFGVLDAVTPDFWGSVFGRYGWTPLYIFAAYVMPIAIGWGLELLTSGSSGGGAAAPQYGQGLPGPVQYPQHVQGSPGPTQYSQYGQRPSGPPHQGAPYNPYQPNQLQRPPRY